ncbi:RHS repeat-associated core domain-containing protein [Pseudomonas fluorescens]|uniref:Type IV secretion protein Rhs n=1 Tax=Pseudomonas fluorescens TaxID=294 RepID=A0A5E7P3N4_PSEFL|nr:RHS repeat-associated core domain-containing protein [Pseudomonas fluorescens]VVP43350.1 hypothetical protein PS880_04963 [Pseudomonas fluorescens]
MNRVAFIDHQLDVFKDCLTVYREQTKSWYAQSSDYVSHKTDIPSLLGMERIIKVGDTSKAVSMTDGDFKSFVAQCPLKGPLLIESKVESVYDIPLGNIEVEIIALDGGAVSKITLDDQGKASWTGGEAGKRYQIRVHNEVTQAQIDELFSCYTGLAGQLEGFLRKEWAGFKPQWPNVSLSGTALAVGNGIFDGGWEAIKGVWDGISLVFDILKDPGKYVDMLGEDAQKLIDQAKQAPDVMKKAMLLASDEAVLFLLVNSAFIWLASLPPTQVAGEAAKMTTAFLVSIVIDIVIALVLSVALEGAGIPYLALRLAHYGERIVKAVIGFVKSLFTIINDVMKYVDKYTKVAARGIVARVEKGGAELRFNSKRNTKLNDHELTDDAAKQSKNPADEPARSADKTCTNGCPVSMVTGEELLTLTDGQLDGLLPFEWTRLYRSSAVELDSRLGHGWSHCLSHRLQQDDDGVLWTDHENRQTRLPLPTQQRPAITNSLAQAAIYLGSAPDELIVTQAGKTPRFYHFQANRLTTISDAYDNQLHLSYDSVGRIQRIDNRAGRSLQLRYDGSYITALDYQQSRPEYTDRGERQVPWVTIQTLVTYEYNTQGQLIRATNAAGEPEHYRYNEQHVIVERQLAGGAAFYWDWEREGKQARCIRHWANFGQMDARYEWDDAGTVKVINHDGSEQVYVHDDNARLISQIDPDGAEHQKAYDEKGRLIAEKDPLGTVTEYHYNEAGRLVAVVPGEDEPTYYQYNNGKVCSVQRGDAQWKYQRNDQGDVIEQIDPNGHRTRYSYTPQGKLNGITYLDGSRHQLNWNGLGQLIDETLPNAGVRRYRYDAQGRKSTQQDETGAITHYQWDAVGRLSQITLPGGATRAYSYNAYGKVTAERDELGRITRYEYADNLHLVSRRINPDGSQLHYRYDNARLLLTSIENERGEHYQLGYSPNGLISQEVGFDGRKTAYQYDLNGHLIEKTEYPDSPDTDELITAYTRDASGRLLEKTLPDGSKVEYHYDRLGRLTQIDDGHWPLAYEYDLHDRLITEHQGWATLRYGYNALGQLSHARLPDGSHVEYQYERGGALKAIDLNGQRLTGHRFEAGRELVRQQGQLLSQYQHDDQGRLQSHSVSQIKASQGGEVTISGQPLYQREYNYDANGNLAGVNDSRKGQKNYHYDPLDRLINVRGNLPESFAHDPAGNLLGQSNQGMASLANVKGNRLLMQGDRHYDYDAYGNLIRERRGTGQKLVTEYRYDCQHRLIGVTLPDSSIATYQYDAFGRRIEKTYEGHTTEFLWQGERLIVESTQQKGINQPRYRSYLYEPGSFRPLSMLDGEGQSATPFYYQLDHLGTPQELTSGSGQIVWSAQYRAYGNVQKLDIAELENNLRFQGQYYDEETGLHYNRHRYYNPNTGRFLTPDPIKLAGGLNNYQYVPNPTGWVDPLGLAFTPCDAPDEAGTSKTRESHYDSLPKLPNHEEGYLYRGVKKGHPAETDAINGRVKPGRIDGNVSPEDHNYGGASSESPFTSWTRSPDIARVFAKEDGVILRLKEGAPKAGDKWSWQYSDDRWGEQEVLLKGARKGDVEVFKP